MLKRIIALASSILILAFISLGAGTSCATDRQLKTVRDHDLRDDQWKEFNAIHENFTRNVFPGCTAGSKLKLTCSGCEYIYITVRITIDSDGKMSGYTKVKENVCGGPAPAALEECFIEYIKSITFPRKLRSIIIETNLGNGLKC
jgi:hypothetical protein